MMLIMKRLPWWQCVRMMTFSVSFPFHVSHVCKKYFNSGLNWSDHILSPPIAPSEIRFFCFSDKFLIFPSLSFKANRNNLMDLQLSYTRSLHFQIIYWTILFLNFLFYTFEQLYQQSICCVSSSSWCYSLTNVWSIHRTAISISTLNRR